MTDLKEEYMKLKEEHEKLIRETSENTIIQSMNDMKEEYERVIQNTVPINRFKALEKRYALLFTTCEAAVVFLEHNRKNIFQMNRYNYDEKACRKAEMEIIVIKDIIQDALANK